MQTSMPPGSNIPVTELPLAPDTGVQLPGAVPSTQQPPTLPGMQAGAGAAPQDWRTRVDALEVLISSYNMRLWETQHEVRQLKSILASKLQQAADSLK